MGTLTRCLVIAIVLASQPGALRTHAATLGFSTYLGGDQLEDAWAIALDQQGNAYVVGGTLSTNFPTLGGLQTQPGGKLDAVISKFDPHGKLLFSTYLGGSGDDHALAVALDPAGDIVVTGLTRSTDFPVTDNAFQPDYGGGSSVGAGDGFIAEISNDGQRLIYASYFGGSGDDLVGGVAFDTVGNLLIAGITTSSDLPTRNAFQKSQGGVGNTGDTFLSKFGPTLSNLVFSTYLGGGDDDRMQALAIDSAGFIYVAGRTLSADFPVTAGTVQTNHLVLPAGADNWDAFITKFTPDGSALVYSTILGGTNYEAAYALVVDGSGNAYVAGQMFGAWDAPRPEGFQLAPRGGDSDAWVAKLRADGSRFEWFSYLGGSDSDLATSLALDLQTNVCIAGFTASIDFPLRDPVQPKYGGGANDAFLAKLSCDGQRLVYSTYVGGSGNDLAPHVAAGAAGDVWVTGGTASFNFPTVNAYQRTNASLRSIESPQDIFLTRITPAVQPPSVRAMRSGSNVLLTWPTNRSDFALQFTDQLDSAPVWQASKASSLSAAAEIVTVDTLTNATRFYRLIRP